MNVVRRSRATISAASAVTLSALFGSRAAVGSSSSSRARLQPRRHQQCERLPLSAGEASHGVVQPVFQPHVQRADSFADLAAQGLPLRARPNPRLLPRRAARARFSAIERPGAVPLNGS